MTTNEWQWMIDASVPLLIIAAIAITLFSSLVHFAIEWWLAGQRNKSKFYKRDGGWGEWR